MPKEEPNVNTEPQKLITRELDVEDVKTIAQRIVDSQPAPEGGTKIYLHEISMGRSPYPITLSVITTDKNQISNLSNLMVAIREGLGGFYQAYNILAGNYYGATATYSIIYLNTSTQNPELAALSLSGRTIESDTVTEL